MKIYNEASASDDPARCDDSNPNWVERSKLMAKRAAFLEADQAGRVEAEHIMKEWMDEQPELFRDAKEVI